MNDETEKDNESLRSLMEAVVNDEASQEQHQRLEQRLLDDQQAREAWLNYANLHAFLNGWFMASDAVESREDTFVELPTKRDGLQASNSRRSHLRWLALSGVFGAVCLLVIVSISLLASFRALLGTPIADIPNIVQFSGDIEVQTVEGPTIEATAHRAVQLGETVISRGDESRVVLRYVDGTEIVLLGASSLTINDSKRGGKKLQLRSGLLQADVARQAAGAPLLIVTPQAQVRVLGTKFELATDKQDGTRLDLDSGQVELVRGDDQPLKVAPSSIAIVPTMGDPIRISPRPAIIETPKRETSFKGLKSVAFADDGETLIASSHWQALYWYEDDRLEVVPFSPRGRKGITFRKQANSLLAYFDHHEQSVKIWDARLRQSRTVLDRASELRRQFPTAVDRPKEWNPISKLAVLSPHGEWFVFQAGREFRVWRDGKDDWPEFAQNYDGKFVGALASSPDGETLAVAVRRQKLDLIDLATGEVATTWSLQHKVPFAMEFSNDGTCVAIGLAGHVAVHDVATGEQLANLEQPGLSFVRVAISADGRYVAASGLGNRVWMWDVMSGAELPLLDVGGSIVDLAFDPSSDTLAVLTRGGRLSVWEVAKPETKSK